MDQRASNSKSNSESKSNSNSKSNRKTKMSSHLGRHMAPSARKRAERNRCSLEVCTLAGRVCIRYLITTDHQLNIDLKQTTNIHIRQGERCLIDLAIRGLVLVLGLRWVVRLRLVGVVVVRCAGTIRRRRTRACGRVRLWLLRLLRLIETGLLYWGWLLLLLLLKTSE